MSGWRRIHGWLSALFAMPMLLAALSGAMLGFARESDRIAHVDLMAAPFSAAAPLSAEQLLKQALLAQPGWRAVGLGLPLTPVDAALVLMDDPQGQRHEVYVHPRTGEVRGERAVTDGLYNQALRLHTTLLVEPTGRWITGLAALGLIMTTLSGLVLRRSHRSGGATARTHPLLGLAAAPLLLLIGASGLFLLLWSPTVGHNPYLALHTPATPAALGNPTPALAALQQAHPNCSPRWLEPFAAEGVRIACEEPHHTGTLGLRWFGWNAVGGLQAQDGLPHSGDLLYNLHTGELLGMPGRILWVLASLAVPLLFIGGLASRKTRIRHPHHE